MTMNYKVTAPLVVARRGDGTYVHVYEGGLLPDDVDAEQLEQLRASNMVADAGSSEADEPTTRRRPRTDE
jgi:hypothetical protein